MILYVPLGRDAVLTEKLLATADIVSCVCASAGEVVDRLAQGAGVLLLAEEAIGTCIGPLRAFVEQQEAWSDLPVLLLTKNGMASLEAQRAVEQLGNVTLLERPVRAMALISFVKSALRARERQYQVRALNRRKDDFLATLAHELRNPLAPILNATAIFQRLNPSEKTDKLVGMVNRQITHLTRLIDDLMDVARINSGKIELQMGPTSVERVVTQAMEIAGAAVHERRHRLVVNLPPGEHPLHADHVRLVQSLANVLVNAAKFTPPGGTITLGVAVEGQAVSFAVHDTGRGFPPELGATIFEMFSQGRAEGEPSTGLGIGLHLAEVFTRMHGGSITARSDGPGQGSSFVITVPLLTARNTATPPAEAAPLQLARKVLVVDDNEDAADTLAELLTLQGMNVSVAYSGVDALALGETQAFDAAIVDVGMPVMNGYDTARALRAQQGQACPQLLALTGWGQYSDVAMARAAGFDHHFVKPPDLARLIACLAKTPARQAAPPQRTV
ncbi:MAG: putative histidine kinase, hybrid [Rhodoferax sp.]|nr:putative histidine kinase, hybrid [Rhodoferax sp.]